MIRFSLLLGAALLGVPALFAPVPVEAQQILPLRAVPGIRLYGVWRDPDRNVFVIEEDAGGRVKGTVASPYGETVATFMLAPHATQGVRGEFVNRRTGSVGEISAYVDGKTPRFYVREGTFLETPRDGDFALVPHRPDEPHAALFRTARAAMQPWLGRWRTTRGIVEFEADQRTLFGGLYAGSPFGYRGGVALIPEQGQAYGAWEGDGMGDIELRLSADGKRFTGWYSELKDGRSARREWTGERVEPIGGTSAPPAGGSPAPAPTAPPLPPPAPAPAPPAPAPAPAPASPAAFQPLNRVEIRLDRLVEARGYPTRQLHAFVTLRNTSASPQYISSGYLRAVLTDADGVAQEKNQVWRASGEPAALFNSTPVVQPGGELKVRYVFTPDPGSVPASLRLSEGERSAVFPAGTM